MIKRLILCIAVLAPLGGFAQTEKFEGPRLRLDKKSLDLGEVKRGEQKTDTVWFTNGGDEPLVIQRIHVDCSCTAVGFTREPVEPKGRGFVAITFDSAGRGVGEFHKSVTIKSNALNYRVPLFIDGKIVP